MAPRAQPAAERLLEDARRICSVAAPTFAEEPRGRLVADMLSAAGLAPVHDRAGNVLATLGAGDAAETVVFAAHLDTVFAAETELAFRERDGRLAAPGLGDNSLAVAALVHLARRLHGCALARPVVLAATVGEEGLGDLRGAKALLDERPCGAFVALEGQMLDSIAVAAVGSLRLRVTVRGPGGHPWGDPENPSAVHELIAPLPALVGRMSDAGLVMNAGVIGGGTAINVIAAAAHVELDLRCEDETRLGWAAETVRGAWDNLAAGVEVEVQQLGHRPGGRIAADHPLLAAARRARERAGLRPARETASSTDANAAHGRGIPALTVGVTTGGNAHRLDEYIDLEPVPAGLAALDALADELTARAPA